MCGVLQSVWGHGGLIPMYKYCKQPNFGAWNKTYSRSILVDCSSVWMSHIGFSPGTVQGRTHTHTHTHVALFPNLSINSWRNLCEYSKHSFCENPRYTTFKWNCNPGSYHILLIIVAMFFGIGTTRAIYYKTSAPHTLLHTSLPLSSHPHTLTQSTTLWFSWTRICLLPRPAPWAPPSTASWPATILLRSRLMGWTHPHLSHMEEQCPLWCPLLWCF